jgi:hypothetical protein
MNDLEKSNYEVSLENSIQQLILKVQELFVPTRYEHKIHGFYKQDLDQSVPKLLLLVANSKTLPTVRRLRHFEGHILKRWYESKMTWISDSIKDQIIPESLISDFFNKQTHAKLIWKSLQSSPTIYNVFLLYLSFELKLSMLEDLSSQKFIQVLQLQSISLMILIFLLV